MPRSTFLVYASAFLNVELLALRVEWSLAKLTTRVSGGRQEVRRPLPGIARAQRACARRACFTIVDCASAASLRPKGLLHDSGLRERSELAKIPMESDTPKRQLKLEQKLHLEAHQLLPSPLL